MKSGDKSQGITGKELDPTGSDRCIKVGDAKQAFPPCVLTGSKVAHGSLAIPEETYKP